jgi:hypothetical protein
MSFLRSIAWSSRRPRNCTGEILSGKILEALCGSVLCAILAVGLWPFSPYLKNEAGWLGKENGVRFGGRGIILSSGTFKITRSPGELSSSLEIWMRPASDNGTGTILALSTRENPKQIRVRQYTDGLLVQREIGDRGPRLRNDEIEIKHVFRQGKEAFITVTAGAPGTAVYLNGVPIRMYPEFGLESNDFSGQLVLGTSPVAYDTWSGQLRGVAIYSQQLTAAQVLQHYATWTGSGRPDIGRTERPVALYLFEEQAGTVIHNQIPSGPDLYVPQRYEILHKTFWRLPWKEFRFNWSYFTDVLINVAGFIPFGFLFCAYLSLSRRSDSARFSTVVLGASVSLAIETLQGYLPTRTSSITDIIMNTFGTGIGATLYSCKTAMQLLARVGSPARPQDNVSAHEEGCVF